MANIRLIRRRIRSISSTAKITRAMEMVAASKMRRAQLRVLAGRPYAEKLSEVLSHLAAQRREGEELHPLLQKREEKRRAVVHITPDRGLCGGLNSNMNRRVAAFILGHPHPVVLITVGRKGRDFMLRTGQNLRAEFTGLGDRPSLLDTLPISHIVIDDYISGFVDRVFLAYPQFVTTMVQRPVLRQILPVEPPERVRAGVDYIYEPSSLAVLAQLLPRFVEMQVYHAILETIASEQSARMVAMRNATENAQEIIEDLTLLYNKARQEMITKELLDITAGAAALG